MLKVLIVIAVVAYVIRRLGKPEGSGYDDRPRGPIHEPTEEEKRQMAGTYCCNQYAHKLMAEATARGDRIASPVDRAKASQEGRLVDEGVTVPPVISHVEAAPAKTATGRAVPKFNPKMGADDWEISTGDMSDAVPNPYGDILG